MRALSTPEGTFVHSRETGLCLFAPDVRSRTWEAPLYAQIALTDRCDQNCWFCYANSSPQGRDSWRLNELKELISFLDSWGVLGVAFGGGEPFLYPHLTEIAEWAWRDTGMDFSVTTNGFAATEPQISRLEGRVSEVRVSVRDAESCNVLRKFLSRRFEVGANLLLFKGGVPVLEGAIRQCLKLGVNDFLVNSFLAVGRGANLKHMEPEGGDFSLLGKLVEKLRHRATFKVSGRLAAMLKPHVNANFVPFQSETRGSIIAITVDKKVKPSSLSEEAYPFSSPDELPTIYWRFANGKLV